MSVPIGIYDFFAQTLPGSLYLFIVFYFCSITGLVNIDFKAINNLTGLQIVLIAMVAYIFGLVLDPIAKRWYRMFRKENAPEKIFAKFKANYPQLELKFRADDWVILRAFIRRHNKDFAFEIERMSVLRLMLRNLSFGFFILAIILVFQFATQGFIPIFIIAGISLFVLSILAGRESAKYGDWFNAGIYEAIIAYGTEASDWVTPKNVHKETKSKGKVSQRKTAA